MLAGAGIGGGVYGASDKIGAFVKDNPVPPQVLGATIYHALGVDYRKALYTPQNRPVAILPDTEPIHELWS